MKIELDLHARSYIRGLLLERADQCRANAMLSKRDGIKTQWQDEAAYASEVSMIVDAGEQEKEPSQVDARRDVDAVDEPPKERSN